MLSDGLMADALYDIKFYELVSEKAQRPALPPLWRFTASELDETCLGFPIELRHSLWTLLSTQCGADPFESTSFAYTLDRANVYIEVFRDLIVY